MENISFSKRLVRWLYPVEWEQLRRFLCIKFDAKLSRIEVEARGWKEWAMQEKLSELGYEIKSAMKGRTFVDDDLTPSLLESNPYKWFTVEKKEGFEQTQTKRRT